MLLDSSTSLFINISVIYYNMVIKKIGLERIKILFDFAHVERKFANRYAEIIKKIAGKAQIKIPVHIKKRICKNCGHFLFPGKNLKVRTSKSKKTVNYTCLDCRKIMRFPYVREKRKTF